MDKSIKLVYDMQFGSTGKGLYVGKLCQEAKPGTVAVSSMAPNAGHTFVTEDKDGAIPFVHSALPLGVIFPNIAQVGIGPGSTIDAEKLMEEIYFASSNNVYDCPDQMIYIHEHAGVRTTRMESEDKDFLRIGSTMKGAGSSQIAKIRRDPNGSPVMAKSILDLPPKAGRFHIRVVDHNEWLVLMDIADNIIIEGSQGYSLGLTSGMWPYTTYRECTPTQILADTAIPCRLADVELYGVARTYPIRVANRMDGDRMVGYSGPGYPDQKELDWDELGLDPEYTTVTKLKRRVFSFSVQQFRQCLMHTHPDVVFLNFVNYLDEEDKEQLLSVVRGEMSVFGQEEAKLELGFGPQISQIRRDDEKN